MFPPFLGFVGFVCLFYRVFFLMFYLGIFAPREYLFGGLCWLFVCLLVVFALEDFFCHFERS